MSQKRINIRSNVVSTLQSAATAAGSRVFGDRSTPIWKSELPVILVYARDEESEPFHQGSDELRRTLRLAIHAEHEGDALDDALDGLAVDIENAMKSDATLGGEAVDSTLIQTEIEVSPEGEKPYGAIRLTYEVTYIT